MKIIEILEKAIKREFKSYSDAISELKKLKLPFEEEEKYEILLYKLLGKEERVVHDPAFFFPSIFNENYFKILQETISLIRDGLYSSEIAQHLFNRYALSPALISYFVNEGLSVVRMNTLSPDEISSIGEAYHKVATHLESKGLRGKPVIENNVEINAIDLEPAFEDELEEET